MALTTSRERTDRALSPLIVYGNKDVPLRREKQRRYFIFKKTDGIFRESEKLVRVKFRALRTIILLVVPLNGMRINRIEDASTKARRLENE